MVNDKSKCAFAGCDEDGHLVRISEVNGQTYRYCGEHDPLANGHSAGFSEVESDA